MDNSHVALVNLKLHTTAFKKYRCDRNLSLGVNLVSLNKLIKCAKGDDSVVLRSEDEPDNLGITFEAKSE
jgi:proliferating cell nuclear antigen